MDMNLSLRKLWEIVKDKEAFVLQSMGSQRVGHDLGAEQQQIHKDLPESTGKSAEYPAMTSMGKESEMGIYN